VTLARFHSRNQYSLSVLSDQGLEGDFIALYRHWFHFYYLALQLRDSCVDVHKRLLARLQWRPSRIRKIADMGPIAEAIAN
jgi:hypothetical protein